MPSPLDRLPLLKILGVLLGALIVVSMTLELVLAQNPDEGTTTPPLTEWPGPFGSPAWEQTVDNGDGTWGIVADRWSDSKTFQPQDAKKG